MPALCLHFGEPPLLLRVRVKPPSSNPFPGLSLPSTHAASSPGIPLCHLRPAPLAPRTPRRRLRRGSRCPGSEFRAGTFAKGMVVDLLSPGCDPQGDKAQASPGAFPGFGSCWGFSGGSYRVGLRRRPFPGTVGVPMAAFSPPSFVEGANTGDACASGKRGEIGQWVQVQLGEGTLPRMNMLSGWE